MPFVKCVFNKYGMNIIGEKKRERKKTIAAKRQERALRRGLDLQAINSVQLLTCSVYNM
jgi:hypothetical protein